MKLVLSIITIVLASCSTVSVYEGDKKVNGVPFYVLKSERTRVSTYHRPFIALSLKTTEFDSDSVKKDPSNPTQVGVSKTSGMYRILDSPDCQSHIDYLQKFVGEQSVPFESIIAEIKNPSVGSKCQPLANVADLNDSQGVFLVSNKVTETLVPDTSEKYYINGRTYLFGKGKADFDLSKKMTLTKVVSEVDTDIGETLLGLLPINSFLTAKYVTPLSSAGEDTDDSDTEVTKIQNLFAGAKADPLAAARFVQQKPAVQADPLIFKHVLSVSSQTVVFQFSQVISTTDPGVIAFGASGTDVQIQWVDASSKPKKASSSDDKNSISFSGQVKLPGGDEKEDSN